MMVGLYVAVHAFYWDTHDLAMSEIHPKIL